MIGTIVLTRIVCVFCQNHENMATNRCFFTVGRKYYTMKYEYCCGLYFHVGNTNQAKKNNRYHDIAQRIILYHYRTLKLDVVHGKKATPIVLLSRQEHVGGMMCCLVLKGLSCMSLNIKFSSFKLNRDI